MILGHFRGLAIGQTLHELKDTHAQQQHRLNSRPSIAQAISRFQCRPRLDQQWTHMRGEQAEAVIVGALLIQQHIHTIQRSLQAKLRKAHPWLLEMNAGIIQLYLIQSILVVSRTRGVFQRNPMYGVGPNGLTPTG
jgi:hypothetical protein